ncbi:hypothetical protein QNO09_33645 [Streptomyces sp. 378]|nr:hypothetical protein [Streptomyces sp. 378]MDK1348137.1 hypothetical protein [Streptomyces sp. 378]
MVMQTSDRYLAVWILIAMAVGLGLGRTTWRAATARPPPCSSR